MNTTLIIHQIMEMLAAQPTLKVPEQNVYHYKARKQQKQQCPKSIGKPIRHHV